MRFSYDRRRFPSADTMENTCPRCRQSNPAEASFCLNCAAPLRPSQPYQQAAQPAPRDESQKGLFAFILAIVALLCCGPFTGVPAAILGWMELEAIKAGRSAPDKKWMAMVGLWGGIVSAVIHIGGYVLWILMGMLSAATADPYYY